LRPPGASGSLWQLRAGARLLLGLLGVSATFAPLVADTSLWFVRRRGIAVAICASGNYLAGALLLCVAGVACCVAMAMPQVHIVAYCGDLGYGAARGAEMLSLMLACGIVSRLVSG
jgi:hypothetical protein